MTLRVIRAAGALEACGKRRAGARGGEKGLTNGHERVSVTLPGSEVNSGPNFSPGFIGVLSLFSVFKLRSRAPNENQIYSAQEYSVY